MAIGTGISAQLGIGAQPDYDTPVTVSRFYEFKSESIETDVGIVRVQQLGGRWLRSDRRKAYVRGAAGSIALTVMTKGFGLLFEHCLGSNVISGTGPDKTHTVTPDANGLQGKALTVQIGRPDITGVVRPFTFVGCKVTEWELKCSVDEPLEMSFTIDAKSVNTTTSIATPSYPAATEPFIFTEGSLTIDGVSQFVKAVSISGNTGLGTDRRALGNVKREPLAADVAAITGSLECEFEDLGRYAAWVSGQVLGNLSLSFQTATLIPSTSTPYSLTISIPAIAYNGGGPRVDGPGVVQQPMEFEALSNGSSPIITITMVTTDTAS